MATPQFKKELNEFGNILMTILLIILPVIIAYYFCRDYPGKGNGPENAPFAAGVVLFVWPPFYFSVRQLFLPQKHYFNAFLLVVFVLLIIQVTLLNPKFSG